MIGTSQVFRRLDEHVEEIWQRDFDIINRLIFVSAQGSVNYGTTIDNSDVDSVIVTLPSVKSLLTGRPQKRYIELSNHEFCTVWEIQKFLDLLLKQNPTVLEILFSYFTYWPYGSRASRSVDRLLNIKEDVARYNPPLAYKAMLGIYQDEFKKICVNIDDDDVFYKAAYHCRRLLFMMNRYFNGGPYFNCILLPEDEAAEVLAYRNKERTKKDILITLGRASESLKNNKDKNINYLECLVDPERQEKVLDTFNQIKLECIAETIRLYGKDYGLCVSN